MGQKRPSFLRDFITALGSMAALVALSVAELVDAVRTWIGLPEWPTMLILIVVAPFAVYLWMSTRARILRRRRAQQTSTVQVREHVRL